MEQNAFSSMFYVPCCMDILGVRIDNLSKKEILEKIEFILNEKRFHQIATVNPEFILEAKQNERFAQILKNCDLNVADGIALKYAFIRHFHWLKTRYAGVDLMREILNLADKCNYSIFLAVNKQGLSSFNETKLALSRIYPSIKIKGAEIDPNDFGNTPLVTDCEVIFCNFGAPQQEIFLDWMKNDTIRLAMGVGGAFDFVTKKAVRAPRVLQYFGFEWLWRLWQAPRYRYKRIIKAIFVFPIRVTLNR